MTNIITQRSALLSTHTHTPVLSSFVHVLMLLHPLWVSSWYIDNVPERKPKTNQLMLPLTQISLQPCLLCVCETHSLRGLVDYWQQSLLICPGGRDVGRVPLRPVRRFAVRIRVRDQWLALLSFLLRGDEKCNRGQANKVSQTTRYETQCICSTCEIPRLVVNSYP